MPRRWHQVGGSISAGDGGKQARSPGRARRKSLKPLGNAGVLRCDRGDYARMLFYFACEAAGASRARHSLRPLMFQMAGRTAKLARMRRDRGGVSVRQLIRESAVVMAGRGDEALLRADVPAIHVFLAVTKPGRGSPGQAR